MLDGTTFWYVFVSSPTLVETLFSHGASDVYLVRQMPMELAFLITDTLFHHLSLPHRSFAFCFEISIHSQV